MTLNDDIEVRTTSVPTAAHLVLAGYEPLGAIPNGRGGKTIRFSPAPSSANKRHGRFQHANTTAALAIRSHATPNTSTLANRSTAKAGPR